MWVGARWPGPPKARGRRWRRPSGAAGAALDEEINRAGMRGKVTPDRPKRRHRSTRRRQDAPPLPRRTIDPRTVGKTYTDELFGA